MKDKLTRFNYEIYKIIYDYMGSIFSVNDIIVYLGFYTNKKIPAYKEVEETIDKLCVTRVREKSKDGEFLEILEDGSKVVERKSYCLVGRKLIINKFSAYVINREELHSPSLILELVEGE